MDDGSFDPDALGTLSISRAPAGPYSLGTTPVTLTVTDDAGRTDHCVGEVSVIDSAPPQIVCPKNVWVVAGSECVAAVPLAAEASDACDSGVDVSDDASLYYPIGSTSVRFTATDRAGNEDTCQTIVAVRDVTPPQLTCPGAIVASCTDLSPVLGEPLVTDACSSIRILENDAPEAFPLGETVVTWFASDVSGNTTSCEQRVRRAITVEGLRPPLAALVPDGGSPPLPGQAFKTKRTLPLKLRLMCGASALGAAEVAPPRLVGLLRAGDALDLAMIDVDAGEANNDSVFFRFEDGEWVYNLSTRELPAGTYLLRILMPDDLIYSATFVLR